MTAIFKVWVASKDSIKLADPLLLKLVSFFDGSSSNPPLLLPQAVGRVADRLIDLLAGVSDIMTISIKSEIELEFVLAKVPTAPRLS